MTVVSAIRRMMGAGLSVEQALLAAEAFELENPAGDKVAEKRRAFDRARKAAKRALKSGGSPVDSAENADIPPSPLSLDKENPPAPPQEIKPKTPLPPNSPAFDEFWDLFPNKVGKADASKAFFRAEQRVGLDELMAGLRRYVAKLDDRPWCNPATWLNQDRWNDQPATVPRNRNGPQSGSKPGSINALIDRRREQRNADELEARIAGGGTVLQLSNFSSG